jgi:hypothetical protein
MIMQRTPSLMGVSLPAVDRIVDNAGHGARSYVATVQPTAKIGIGA